MSNSEQQPEVSNCLRLALPVAAVTLAAAMVLMPEAAANADEHPSEHSQSYVVPAAHERQSNPSQSLVITTYNILGSIHKETGREVGGSVEARAHREEKYVEGHAGAPKSDILGVQEMERDQWRMFNNFLEGYNVVPKGHAEQNSIFYNSERFEPISDGTLRYPYYSDPTVHGRHGVGVWARFKDKETGQILSILNAHYVAWNERPGTDPGGAMKRLESAKLSQEWVIEQQEKHPDDAVYVIGDLNSINNVLNFYNPSFDHQFKDRALQGDRNKIPYCILTKNPNKLQDTRDMLEGRQGHCENHNRGPAYNDTIDWIYTTPKYTHVVAWKRPENKITLHASDHLPLTVVAEATQEPAAAPTA
ncbi:MAG: endonuclease [Candidatus Saccharibacteria bacterium]|nr:endonuclease [Candidatus Saccharibacteria bacterium]